MLRNRVVEKLLLCSVVGMVAIAGCTGEDGINGMDGIDGTDGTNGDDGNNGNNGNNGTDGLDGNTVIDPFAPLSGMVALAYVDDLGTGAADIPSFVRAMVQRYADDSLAPTIQFPLAAAATDSVRALKGLSSNVVIKWLDPLTFDKQMDAPYFGANADFIAYFGEGWDASSPTPTYAGSDNVGWVWVNHEYISNSAPSPTSAPQGQHLTFAQFLKVNGVIGNDIVADTWNDSDIQMYIDFHKRQVGGSWFRIVQDPSTGEWQVDRNADNLRYDGTSNTLAKITGTAVFEADHDDAGGALPMGVASGITGDCSGGVTPWGTIVTAEENVQGYYGDLEACWTSQQKFVAGTGFDPGANINPTYTPSDSGAFSRSPDANAGHNRDLYGYLVEIDVGVPSAEFDGAVSPGVGHKKIGAMGRARWENATFATGTDWQLAPGQRIVMYGANDRRGGRIYKFVSRNPYTPGMTRSQIRALMDDGDIYVAHFAGLDNTTGDTMAATSGAPTEAAPGNGTWVHLSVDNVSTAPNAAALGDASKTVGDALKDVNWNGIGGFPSNDWVRRAMFTAATKIGVMELNRPEDLEWNPLDPSGTPRLYIAFTKHGRKTALNQDGVLYDPATHDTMSIVRPDKTGSIFVLEESNPNNPGTSTSFNFFQIWKGTKGSGVFDAANPDNIMIDAYGGVWFGTDGNYWTNSHSDAVYYLDLDDAHRTTAVPTYGKAFRVAAAPADAEATGPAFSSAGGSLFFNVQHPGEDVYSTWPRR